MTDQLIEKLEVEIAEHKAMITEVENQIGRVSWFLVNEPAECVSCGGTRSSLKLTDFEIIFCVNGNKGTWNKAVCQKDVHLFNAGSEGTKISKPIKTWLSALVSDVDNYLESVELQKQRDHFNELLTEARKLGIDVTPYEAECAEASTC